MHTKGYKIFNGHIKFRDVSFKDIRDLMVIGTFKNILKQVKRVMNIDYIEQNCGHQTQLQCIRIMRETLRFIRNEIQKYETRTNDVKNDNIIDIMLDEEIRKSKIS